MNSVNTDNPITSVGMIGLGVMGLAISTHIVNAGFEVIGYDILQERIENLVAKGGKAAGSASEVSQKAQVVLISLPSHPALKDVIWGKQGILASGAEGLIAMECSTLAVTDKERACEDMAKAGMTLLDCPISGGARAAQKDLVVFGSGHQVSYERCQPVVNAYARANYYLGEFGNGSKMKLVANLLVAIHNVSTAEAMVFGMKSGLDPATIFKVICDSSARSRMFEVRGPRMVEDNYDNPSMKVKLFHKDLEIIGRHATDINCPTPLFTSSVQVYLSALAQGLEEQDTASVCAVLENWAHLKREQMP